MQSSTLDLQVARVRKSYLDGGGGIALNTKWSLFIAKQVPMFIASYDSPTR
jgi:hypothetical protein